MKNVLWSIFLLLTFTFGVGDMGANVIVVPDNTPILLYDKNNNVYVCTLKSFMPVRGSHGEVYPPTKVYECKQSGGQR